MKGCFASTIAWTVCLFIIACLNGSLQAANDLYWDTNGTAEGSGAATGTWGSSLFWNTDSAGLTNTFQSTTDGSNDLHFSAGTNGTNGTITVSGAQSANGLYFEEGAVSISGGTSITLSDGAFINNTTGMIPTISTALVASGTVTLTGTRIWLNNPSFDGGGTLNVNTSNATLLENSGALNGLAIININSGGLDIRTGGSSYNYAAGTTLNFVNSSGLNTNLTQSVNWLGSITIASTKVATLSAFNAASTFTISGGISGAGGVTIGGSGIMVFSGTNTYAGTTSVSASTLQITGGSAIADMGLVAMGTGSSTNTLDVQSSEIIGALSGGTATFSVVNLAAGQVLTLSSGTQTYSGTFTGTGSLIVAGAQQTLASAVTLADVTVSSGMLTLSAANTITNGLALSGGTVVLRDAGAAGASAIQASGGTLQLGVARGSTLTLPNAIIVTAGAHTFLSPQTNGGSSGTATLNFGGPLTVNAGGILTLNAPAANAAYGTANGALVFGAAATSGTKFQLNGNSFTLTGLSTDAATPGTATVENGSTSATTLTVALGAATANTYAGILRNGSTGTLALILNSAADSVLTLSGANTFTGATTVTSGSLVLANSLALQGSTVTTGGTGLVFDSSVASHSFTFGGLSGSIDLVLEDNAANAVTLAVGNNNSTQTYSGVLSGTGGLTKVGTGQFSLSAASTYTGATTVNGGELRVDFSLAGAPVDNIISASSTLVLGGGMLTERQLSNAHADTQTFNGISIKTGSSANSTSRQWPPPP